MEQETVKTTKTANINLRIPFEDKKKWQAEAEEKGLTLSDYIRLLEQNFSPLPPVVEATVLDLSQQLGISVNDVISIAVLSMLARTDAELQALGRPLLNCYLVERNIPWTEVYSRFKKEYLDNLWSGEASFQAQELWAAKQRNELLKARKNMGKAARAKRKAREQAEYAAEMEQSTGAEREQDNE